MPDFTVRVIWLPVCDTWITIEKNFILDSLDLILSQKQIIMYKSVSFIINLILSPCTFMILPLTHTIKYKKNILN